MLPEKRKEDSLEHQVHFCQGKLWDLSFKNSTYTRFSLQQHEIYLLIKVNMEILLSRTSYNSCVILFWPALEKLKESVESGMHRKRKVKA